MSPARVREHAPAACLDRHRRVQHPSGGRLRKIWLARPVTRSTTPGATLARDQRRTVLKHDRSLLDMVPRTGIPNAPGERGRIAKSGAHTWHGCRTWHEDSVQRCMADSHAASPTGSERHGRALGDSPLIALQIARTGTAPPTSSCHTNPRTGMKIQAEHPNGCPADVALVAGECRERVPKRQRADAGGLEAHEGQSEGSLQTVVQTLTPARERDHTGPHWAGKDPDGSGQNRMVQGACGTPSLSDAVRSPFSSLCP